MYSYTGQETRSRAVELRRCNPLVSASAATFTFCATGNLLSRVDSRGTTTYTDDGLNGLTGIAFADRTQAGYKYDPLGRHIEKN
jgi:YD repeat-containing protein